ncbi:MAG: protein translocase SEC61 complex subunit gamma [Candidatus Bathyarchaeota archaeon]|nr:protein translocase SEC61 complex subunit gamma [Candidatus Termiticorpusculum sp.]
MGVKSFLSQCARTLKLAVKPGREELWLSIKISALGIGVIGLIGFAIKLIGSFLGGSLASNAAAVSFIGSAIKYVTLFALGGA